ncbi:hypothetical protein EV193_106321 [Herbihabitans rhizosphaerae]|uniref:MalT-like TPR region domain-containing protein n=2 Tax=Herbihabitans rhizosphaerae TaxID=1872711 RepID=A0A4Q7KKS0_9PSEU|nr:hypothetical protein EV193_106321 [Herbihabitans rhizosphaerae]
MAGVALGGQGSYASANRALITLLSDLDRVTGALAATTIASHRRQLGGHAAARVLDSRALGLLAGAIEGAKDPDGGDPDGGDALGARSDALLGLAADALGGGRLGEARRMLARARRLGDTRWRAGVRLAWVTAEVELASGAPEAAIPPAESAVERARACASVRHQVKSDLVLAAALAARGGSPARARALLDDVAETGVRHGLVPLVWPAHLLLAEVDAKNADRHRAEAMAVLRSVLLATDPAGRRLAADSPWVPKPVAPTR